MLTGFDSKWINTLYMDKVLKYEAIIQAFSRTNRLFGTDKPFGTIRYYRYPHTMERNINAAVKLYSGDKPLELFADRLEKNLNKLNIIYNDIYELFNNAKIENFEKLPAEISERGEFAKLFRNFNNVLEAAKIQGFKWSNLEYEFKDPRPKRLVRVNLDERIYLILVQRYKELSSGDGNGGGYDDVPFEIESYITEIDTGKIDAAFMNSRFEKYCKTLYNGNESEIEATFNELHKSFASLTQEEQKFANLFIHDVQNGDIQIDVNKTFKEYIIEYQTKEKDEQIRLIVANQGLDEKKLRYLMSLSINEQNINDFGRFDELKNSVDKVKAKIYFEELAGCSLPAFKINIKIDEYLRNTLANN